MRPPSLHSNFFSSLKRVEKRLKLEQPPDSGQSITSPPLPETDSPPVESLSSPLYLHFDQPTSTNGSNCTNLQESSEPPPEFLSSSSPFLATHQKHRNQPQTDPSDPQTTTKDTHDIETLMQLLGLSDHQQETQQKGKQRVVVCNEDSCGYECGFYGKIVGVKGPKCEKEVERMERWIRYFMENDKEPLRLAFLLLGRAAFESSGNYSSGGMEFPSAMDEFLKKDPPKE
ncbi:hypothetical protein SLA2020_241000 [Shorea laevis]